MINLALGIMILVFSSSSVRAEELLDPTKPVISVRQAAVPSTAKTAALTTAVKTPVVEEKMPILQSILIAKERRIAIIGSRPVVVGSKVDKYIVTEIRVDGVTLLGPQGKVLLKFLNVLPNFKRARDHKTGTHS